MISSTREGRWGASLWGLLAVLCLVIFLDGLDVSMVGVALPSIQAELGMSTSALQWVVSGYVLGYGGLLLLGGRTADLLGRRRVLLIALAVFAVASLLGGLVDDGGLLIAARFIKGIAAAFTAPAALSIITTTFAEGPARNRALSIFTACAASGYSLGLVLSGLLTELGWRWTFLMPAPVALIALAVGYRVIPRGADRADGGQDILGAVAVAAGMLLLVFTVVEAPEASVTRTAITGAASLLLLAAFVVRELTARHPLVRLGILRSRPLAVANLGMIILFGSYMGFQFVGMQYFQNYLGWSPLETALAFLPAGILVALTSTKMGGLADRFGTPKLIFIGSIALLLGYANFLRIGENPGLWTLVLPGMLLLGLAFALQYPALNIQGTSGVPDDEQGLASGLVSTSGQVGGAVVLAIVTGVLTSGTGADPIATLRSAIVVSLVFAAIGLVVTLVGLRARTRPVAEQERVLENV